MSLEPEQVNRWSRLDDKSEDEQRSIKALSKLVDHLAVSVAARSSETPPYDIIDAPGLGASEECRAISERYLCKSDVPIVVTSFGVSKWDLTLQEVLRQIKSSGHQPIVVITKLDQHYGELRMNHGDDADVRELIEQSKRDSRQLFVNAGCLESDVHFVSALWYDTAKKSISAIRAALETAGMLAAEEEIGEKAARERLEELSGIPAFWAAVDALVLRDAARRRAKRICEELSQHL